MGFTWFVESLKMFVFFGLINDRQNLNFFLFIWSNHVHGFPTWKKNVIKFSFQNNQLTVRVEFFSTRAFFIRLKEKNRVSCIKRFAGVFYFSNKNKRLVRLYARSWYFYVLINQSYLQIETITNYSFSITIHYTDAFIKALWMRMI